MTVKPILFSAPMIHALLAGRKTQTRRIIKPRGEFSLFNGTWADSYILDPGNAEWRGREVRFAVGNLLWVRETFWHDEHGLRLRADNHVSPCGWKPSIFMPREFSRLTLEVTDVRVQRLQEISAKDALAEGVDDSEFYSNAEHKVSAGAPWSVERLAFADLWNSLNKKPAYVWDANPWIAAISFAVHKQNIDVLLRDRGAA